MMPETVNTPPTIAHTLVVEEEDARQRAPLSGRRLAKVLGHRELVGTDWRSGERRIDCRHDLEEVLVHAGADGRAARSGRRLGAAHTVQRVLHARVAVAEAEAVDGVREVEHGVAKRRDVVHVHGTLLVGPPRRKVEVAGDLVHVHRAPHAAALAALLVNRLEVRVMLALLHPGRVGQCPASFPRSGVVGGAEGVRVCVHAHMLVLLSQQQGGRDGEAGGVRMRMQAWLVVRPAAGRKGGDWGCAHAHAGMVGCRASSREGGRGLGVCACACRRGWLSGQQQGGREGTGGVRMQAGVKEEGLGMRDRQRVGGSGWPRLPGGFKEECMRRLGTGCGGSALGRSGRGTGYGG
eukprot:362555-Chlamydomonas_euryale.AAC.11